MKISENIKDKLFFTSDTHFFHKNIIEFASRPFETLEEMHNVLVDNWNSVVPKDGTVYHLGDFALGGNFESHTRLRKRLNGEIVLLLGNHCYQNKLDRTRYLDLFKIITDVISLKVKLSDGEYLKLFMSHYPHLYWQRGFYHLHGHIHSGPNSTASEVEIPHRLRYDIGVDNNNYYPVSFDGIVEIFNNRKDI